MGSYAIRIKGHLDDRWGGWFEDLTITRLDDGDTLLSGPLIDQAALHGVLARVRDLGLALIAVTPGDEADSGSDEAKGTGR